MLHGKTLSKKIVNNIVALYFFGQYFILIIHVYVNNCKQLHFDNEESKNINKK